MRKFKVNVNGVFYEVEVEEITGTDSIPAAPKPAAHEVSGTAAKSNGGEKVKAPMPGTVIEMNVKPGSVVKAGDTLLILEAMKMENEIPAPCGGRITDILVTKGSSVNSGDVLCVIE